MPNPKTLVRAAIEVLLSQDRDLLVNDVSERTIAQHLAYHLMSLFPGWNVDCEYNREMEVVKRLKYGIEPKGLITDREVQPDIIVHRRKTLQNPLSSK